MWGAKAEEMHREQKAERNMAVRLNARLQSAVMKYLPERVMDYDEKEAENSLEMERKRRKALFSFSK